MTKTEKDLLARKSANKAAVSPPEPAAYQSVPGLGLATLVYFALAIVYFFPAFLPGRHIFGTDYFAGGYFFFNFVSERLDAGELPRWVPYIYGGLPLASNPGSTFFPIRLLADFLFPVTWILPFIFVFQFGIAGVGMYLLARELGCRPWVAFLAGLAFQFTGITASSVYAGHDGRVIVATFAPLVFYFLHRGIRTGALASFVGAAATIGFSLLSFQIQSNYYLLLAAAVWAVFALFQLGLAKNPRSVVKPVVLGIAAVAFGFSLAAVNFLPFLDYVPASPRGAEGGRGYDYSVTWSMPPVELAGVAVPERAGILDNYLGDNPFKLHTEYVGALVLVLLVLGLRYSRGNRYWWFFAGLGAFALSIAFGGYTPLYRLYYAVLPGTTRFRAPSLSYFIFALSLVAMAALTLERISAIQADRPRAPTAKKARSAPTPAEETGPAVWLLATVAVAVVALVIAAASRGTEPRDAAMVAGFGRFALFTAAVSGSIWLWWQDRLRTVGFVTLMGLITVADLWIIDRNFFETIPPPEVTFAPDDVVGFFASRPKPTRVWVLPGASAYRGGGNYLMLYGIEQAGGEHGNQLQRFNEFVGAGQEVYVDWSNFSEHPNFLNAANVQYIISTVELSIPFLREVHRGSAIVYANTGARPRAYLVEQVIATTDTTAALTALATPDFDVARSAVVYGPALTELSDEPLESSAEIVEATPDRVVVRTEANRPALLVLADNYYPGWRATVNGVESPILRTNHTFRGVVVGSGASEVVFEFRPTDLQTGFYIYLAGLTALAVYGVWLLVSSRRNRKKAIE